MLRFAHDIAIVTANKEELEFAISEMEITLKKVFNMNINKKRRQMY